MNDLTKIPPAHLVVLARLPTGGTKGATGAQFGKDVAPLLGPGEAGHLKVQRTLVELEAAGPERPPATSAPLPAVLKFEMPADGGRVDAPLNLADFARQVLEAAAASPTGRFGFVEAVDPGDARASEIRHFGATFHFIRLGGLAP